MLIDTSAKFCPECECVFSKKKSEIVDYYQDKDDASKHISIAIKMNFCFLLQSWPFFEFLLFSLLIKNLSHEYGLRLEAEKSLKLVCPHE